MNATILVVDDEQSIADLIQLYLENEGFTVFKFFDPLHALHCLEHHAIDCAVLDVMMPHMDGFTLLQKIRQTYTFPVVFLTAKEQDLDKINGLTLGADDYITKPFHPLELIARIKAQLRRYTQYNTTVSNNIIAYQGLVMNRDSHQCHLNEKPLNLTPTEFSILWLLSEKRGTIVSAETLFELIWKEKYYTNDSNTVMVHIRHIREKMKEPSDKPKYIKTVWGVGYTIEK